MAVKGTAKLVADTFDQAYDEDQFCYFIRNFLKDFDETDDAQTTYQGAYLPDSYKSYVKRFRRHGKYVDPNGQRIDVLSVKLETVSNLERARTMQRNFIGWFLNGSRGGKLKDAALVAFFTEDQDYRDWRFSFVKMDYQREVTEDGEVKVEKELTPARRFSFLVGETEPNHTAQKQLLSVLEQDGPPTQEEIESAFAVDKVSERFFEEYKDLFVDIRDAVQDILDKDEKIAEEFEAKEIEPDNFSKKLLGQVVFLYFIQKKGWLGVGRDENGNLKQWGTGPKDFLSRLFEGKIVDYDNFYNEVLEPLFYEALAIDRGEKAFYQHFECRIPFLNGGLFEPINDYNWQETDIEIPNEVFAKLFETFDRYNFTVREDQPLDKEVAIDPEMLGKIYERMLDVEDRKSKGAFYTPREIVHFMCQESLINYLSTQFEDVIQEENIRILVEEGEMAIQHEEARLDGTVTYDEWLPVSIQGHAEEIDEVLKAIKVCDPAIGSGAFPVGMMHEIVKVRRILTPYLDSSDERTRYEFKRHTILNSLYGVDIDPSSVDIAKLRLWLSLVVDEQDYQSIKPLPNLEYKIMQGDSLVEEYEGIELFDPDIVRDQSKLEQRRERLKQKQSEKQQEYFDLELAEELSTEEKKRKEELEQQLKDIRKQLDSLGEESDEENGDLFSGPSEARRKAEELEQKQKAFVNAVRKREKKELREEIEELQWDLIGTTLKEHGEEEKLDDLEEIKQSRRRPFFLWELYFSDVFLEKDGFDVVIANPPYVRQEDLGELKSYLEDHYETYYGTADFYTYFIERGYKLLNDEGVFCYITSNKWMRAKYGKPLRQWLQKRSINKLIDFGDYPVFDSATTYPCILIMSQSDTEREFSALDVEETEQEVLEGISSYVDEQSFTIEKDFLSEDGWTLVDEETQDLLKKIRSNGVPLKEYIDGKIYYGIKTGLNDAFVISRQRRDEITQRDPSSQERLKPFLKGRDIKRYGPLSTDKYLIFFPNGWTNENASGDVNKWQWIQETYPAIADHLEDYEPRAKERYDQGEYWWELRACDYYDKFEKPKIMFADIAERGSFTLDAEGEIYCATTGSLIPTDDMFLLGALNSKLMTFYYEKIAASYRGGYLRFKRHYLKSLPVMNTIDSSSSGVEKRDQITEDVNKMLKLSEELEKDGDGSEKSKVKKIMEEIDQKVDEVIYDIYCISDEEIKIIEGHFN